MAASFEDLLQRAVEVSRFEAFAERMSRPAHPPQLCLARPTSDNKTPGQAPSRQNTAWGRPSAGGPAALPADHLTYSERPRSHKERRQAQQRVQAAMDSYGREEVSRGAVFLVGVLTAHIIGQQDGPEEDRLDPLSDLIPVVIRKLPGSELAEAPELRTPESDG
jgi:hypothetical protein